MGQRFYKIIVAVLFSAGWAISYGQDQPKFVVSEYSKLVIRNVRATGLWRTVRNSPASDRINFYFPQIISEKTIGTIEENFYTKDFGFFCRKELQFERSTGLPLRIRLGSLAYCNSLEDFTDSKRSGRK
ncbi:MAG TPA: hypothetical protein VM012_10535 [Flavitalea sp.]|nr:hypothetical protein [Flavitalea sp.]